MIIFITGPSGVGKSTLRDYYCKIEGIKPIPAITTRENRPGEVEIHRTVSEKVFKQLLIENRLCLVSNNHGFNYGYLIDELNQKSNDLIVFEIDSKTAIRESIYLKALIVRIVPFDINYALREIQNKRDNTADRTNDLFFQMNADFIDERKALGDFIFVNYYNNVSLQNFKSFINKIVQDAKK